MSSQENVCYENSERESECETKYECIQTDNEYEDSGSDDDEYHDAKKSKLSDELLIDENGHIQWHPGQVIDNFEVRGVLGEGTFGRVLRVQNIKDGREAALKVIKSEPNTRKSAMTEVIVLTMIEQRDRTETSFCIKMLSWFLYDGHACIAFPLLGMSVFEWLEKNNFKPYDIDEVCHISYQLTSAVKFLHKNGITHTDLKPENMLLVDVSFTTMINEKTRTSSRKLNSTHIRVSDFGSAALDTDEYHQPIITTQYYRAPEVMLQLGWNNSCDIWSIGCILIELYTGKLLFPAKDDREQLAMMEEVLGEIPIDMVQTSTRSFCKDGKLDWDWSKSSGKEHCRPLKAFQLADSEAHQQLFSVIEKLLQFKPDRRITSSEVLTQPFYVNLMKEQQRLRE